jgi:cysteine desulfurase / selenocysteine lyase
MPIRHSVTPLDAGAIRADFPILANVDERGQRLVYLDSAASSQKPQAVIDAIEAYYREANANIHRGVYALSDRATARFEEARHIVADFINAASPRECVFVRNTTEALNLVANAWGRRNVHDGDLIVVSEMEHHSNIVPWQLLAEQTGARIEAVPVTDEGVLDLDAFERLLAQGPKVVAVAHVSNSAGTINPVAEIARKSKAVGATVVIDGAQAAPHLAVDVQALGADFYAFSGHKMLAPMGAGVLYGRLPLLEAMPPFMGGGGMIRKVEIGRSTWADVPARFEAGTPAVGDAIVLGVAIDYLKRVGMDRIRAHERELTAYALERLGEIEGLTILGPLDAERRGGVISFDLAGIHPHDVAAILDGHNVAVRAGHHCCQPLMRKFGLAATTRASVYLYNDAADVDRLVEGLLDAKRIFEA